MAKKNKIEKSIKSFSKRIEEHKKKIQNFSGKNDLVIGYWKNEIKHFKDMKKEKEKKLRK
ncbi:hypothetical protein J4411_00975 [Candidatus Pacearchaeota archaeon]|nr:hypothetical protein [uncultured archaeon]MBS3084466.1 hypothetical protein [Candidatus Pacearchaeota archaeon]